METSFFEGAAPDAAHRGEAALTAEEASAYLTMLARLAGLEGIGEAERSFVDRAAETLGFAPEAARRAEEVAADAGVPIARLLERVGDPGLRLCLLRDAYRLAAADDEMSDAELRELSAIVAALELAPHVAAAVRSVALQEARIRREFAILLREARAGR